MEITESRKRRGRDGESPCRELQKQFFVQAMTGWENQILQNAQNAQREAAQKKEAVDVNKKGENAIAEEREVKTMAS